MEQNTLSAHLPHSKTASKNTDLPDHYSRALSGILRLLRAGRKRGRIDKPACHDYLVEGYPCSGNLEYFGLEPMKGRLNLVIVRE